MSSPVTGKATSKEWGYADHNGECRQGCGGGAGARFRKPAALERVLECGHRSVSEPAAPEPPHPQERNGAGFCAFSSFVLPPCGAVNFPCRKWGLTEAL